MSKHDRTQARKKTSVSSHPLFPAIVALWFGALFGLGSLAIRPSILESLVLSSHLDVVLPMTAPPLGITARILLALTMAVVGIAAGAMIARRIARPRPEKRERRRGAAALATANPKGRTETSYGQATQRQSGQEAAPGRRRALAVEEEERDDYRLRAAPLPGGLPEIFDVTQIDMAEPVVAAMPEAAPMPAEPVRAPQPLELGSFAAPEQAFTAAIASDGAVPSHPDARPDAHPDDCLVLDESSEAPAPRQIFGQPQHASSVPADEEFAPAALGPAPELTPQSFAPAPPPPVFTPVLDNPAMTAFEPQTELRRFDGPTATDLPGQGSDSPEAVFAPAPQAAPQPVATPAAGLVLPQDTAAQRIVASDLAELSPVELVERFALALQQRRSKGTAPAGLAEAAAAFVATEPAPASPEPAPFAAPAPVAAMPSEPIPAPIQHPMPSEFLSAKSEEIAAAAPSSPLALPASLRPIDFSAYEDLDDHHSFVPPRTIGMPATAAAPLAEPVVAPAAAEAAAAGATAQAEVAVAGESEAEVLEEGYSSLLDLNRPVPLRQTFVRIEEPLAEAAVIEPVVVFPGQDARPSLRFARPAEVVTPTEAQAAPEPGVTPLRRFDSPDGTAAPAASPQDPAEAERALRSALATLQRMSGAA